MLWPPASSCRLRRAAESTRETRPIGRYRDGFRPPPFPEGDLIMQTSKCGKQLPVVDRRRDVRGCAAVQPDGVRQPAAAKLSPAEAQAIAEEGFIYGLPMVMDYAVMYDFIINRDSPAWKAPFNTLRNEARVFTSADTTVVTPNSDTPYSLRVGGPAGGADRDHGAADRSQALLLGDDGRQQHVQLRDHRHAHDRQRAPATS